MAIKRILGGKSKNLCDVAYLLTLPIDTNFANFGFWEVEINVEPNTTYTLSRENSDVINLGATTYLGLSNEYSNPTPDDAHHKWLNHQAVPSRCRKSVTLTSNADGKLWIFFSGQLYKRWEKYENPFGYLQLEKGSSATEYVPYEITSYKSIMKVSDNFFITSFDERMPCKTKNLFSSSTEVGVPSSTKFDKSEKRLLEDGKWYVGFAVNNYYSPNNIIEYKIFPNQVYVKTKGSGYGVAKCFYCEPNTPYSLQSEVALVNGNRTQVGVGFYQEDGTFISNVDILGGKISFTTPTNCRYCILGFIPSDAKGAAYFSNIQLEKGSTVTDYVPYGYV